jgi:hypothetical protein
MGLRKGSDRGGRRAGAGRKLGSRRKTTLTKLAALGLPPTATRIPAGCYAVLTPLEASPVIAEALSGIRTALEAQGASLDRLHQHQRQRNEFESGSAILRRLTELERLVRGDPSLTKPARLTRARPLGVE